MAADGDAIITFIFNGEDPNDIPEDVTHLIIHESITVIPARLFKDHPNLIEVHCHKGVTKIEACAFEWCLSLRRVIIPGVTIVERWAFAGCENLVYIECGKLERIGECAFMYCESLSSINLPSAKIVEQGAFQECESLSSINLPSAKIVGQFAFDECPAMTQAIFREDLESIRRGAFGNCSLLESITIPLRNGLFPEDDTFAGCDNLKRVDLVEDEALRNFADALLVESWGSDVHDVLDSINEILPDTAAGEYDYDDDDDQQGDEKAIAIQEWIESVLRKVTHYKAAHRELLDETATALQLSLPNDTVINNILPFVELPALTLGGEDESE